MVRAAMLCFGVGERAEGTNGQGAGTAGRDVAELPAFPALGAFRGGKHLFDSPVPGEEIDGGENGVSVRRGHGDNNGGGSFLFARFRVWVKVTRRENGDSPGIADGLVQRGKELVIVRGEESKRDGVNQELCFIRSGFEDFARGVAYRIGLVQPRGKGSEIGGISGGKGVKVGTEQ